MTTIILILLLVFIILEFRNIPWWVHLSMTKEQRVPYDIVTFDRFLEEFNKYKDDERLEYNKKYNSFVLYGKNLEKILDIDIHASIIMFNNKCMIIRYRDWHKFVKWEKENKKKYGYGRVVGLWEEDNGSK